MDAGVVCLGTPIPPGGVAREIVDECEKLAQYHGRRSQYLVPIDLEERDDPIDSIDRPGFVFHRTGVGKSLETHFDDSRHLARVGREVGSPSRRTDHGVDDKSAHRHGKRRERTDDRHARGIHRQLFLGFSQGRLSRGLLTFEPAPGKRDL